MWTARANVRIMARFSSSESFEISTTPFGSMTMRDNCGCTSQLPRPMIRCRAVLSTLQHKDAGHFIYITGQTMPIGCCVLTCCQQHGLFSSLGYSVGHEHVKTHVWPCGVARLYAWMTRVSPSRLSTDNFTMALDNTSVTKIV